MNREWVVALIIVAMGAYIGFLATLIFNYLMGIK